MTRPEWTWQICDAAGQALAELATAGGRSISWQRNMYSEAQFTISHEDDAAKLLLETYYNTSPFTVGTPTLRCWRRATPGQPATLQFNGYLAALDEDLSDTALLTPVFRSPFARLKGDTTDTGWFTDGAIEFTARDAGQIAADLITTANGVAETGLSIGSIGASIPRDRTLDYVNIGEEIIDLSNMLDGFDFDETPTANGYKLAQFNTYQRQGSVRPQAQFGYGPDTMANVQGVQRRTLPPINDVRVMGGNGLIGTAVDAASRGSWGRWPLQSSASNVIEQKTLNDIAGSLIRPRPIKTINFTPELGMPGCPRPIDDFWLGDTVTFVGRRGAFVERQAVRINAIKLVLDDNGFEAVEVPDPVDPEGERVLRAHLQMEVTDEDG